MPEPSIPIPFENTLVIMVVQAWFKQSLFTFQNLKQKTVSLWSLINTHVDEYKNPMYVDYLHQHVLYPVVSLRRIQLWNSYYLRWNPKMRPQVSLLLSIPLISPSNVPALIQKGGHKVQILLIDKNETIKHPSKYAKLPVTNEQYLGFVTCHGVN